MRNFVRTLFGEVNSLASSRCMRHLGAESVPKGCSGPVWFLPRVDLERMKGLSLAKKGEVRDSKHPHLPELDRLQGVSCGYLDGTGFK